MYTTRRGMGDSGCPSLEQLQGISDVNDPCQVAAGVTATGDTIVPAAITSPTAAIVKALAAGQTILSPSPTQPGPLSFLQANPLLMIGGGLILLLLLSKGGRR